MQKKLWKKMFFLIGLISKIYRFNFKYFKNKVKETDYEERI